MTTRRSTSENKDFEQCMWLIHQKSKLSPSLGGCSAVFECPYMARVGFCWSLGPLMTAYLVFPGFQIGYQKAYCLIKNIIIPNLRSNSRAFKKYQHAKMDCWAIKNENAGEAKKRDKHFLSPIIIGLVSHQTIRCLGFIK